jgi:hypothetical protein
VLNADLGRWTGRDPIGYVESSNLYAYAVSNPIALLDPTGTMTCAQCNSAVNACLDSDTELLTIRAAIFACAGCLNPPCAPPDIYCCGSGSGIPNPDLTCAGLCSWAGAVFCPESNSMCICVNGISESTGYVCDLLVHEHVHAFDQLCGPGIGSTCGARLCAEIRANHCSGECASSPDYWGCIRSRSIASAVGVTLCSNNTEADCAYRLIFANCMASLPCPGGLTPPPAPPVPTYTPCPQPPLRPPMPQPRNTPQPAPPMPY